MLLLVFFSKDVEVFFLFTNEYLKDLLIDDLFMRAEFLEKSIKMLMPKLECLSILDYLSFNVSCNRATAYSDNRKYESISQFS